jgi:hypothetical protein
MVRLREIQWQWVTGLIMAIAVEFILARLRHPALSWTGIGAGVAAAAIIVVQAARGGRIARKLLVGGCAAAYLVSVLSIARFWGIVLIALVIMLAAQLVIVARPGGFQSLATVGRSGQLAVPRTMIAPLTWLLPWGLFIAAVLTAAFLAHISITYPPSCIPTATDNCASMSRGYPLDWLSAPHGSPQVDVSALLADYVQWAFFCVSSLYLVCVVQLTPANRLPQTTPATARTLLRSVRTPDGRRIDIQRSR